MDRIKQMCKARTGDVREALRVPRGSCRLVRCAQSGVVEVIDGRVLMTVEGDAADYWLEPGEALPFAPGERVWIGGWNEAVCCEVRTTAPRLGVWSAWSTPALRAWLARLAARLGKRPARARMRALRG
jgi:hypothetical protein